MSKYTPGPWKFIDVIGCCAIEAADRQLLKYMSPTSTNVANARLMASAPDLLEALEAVLSVADRATDEFDLARAAIAKAKGESQ